MESPSAAAADVIKAAKVATHRRYAGFVIARARQTVALFQERFGLVAMDEAHLMAAARYATLKPGADRTGRQGQLSRATTRKIKRPSSNGGCAPFSPSLEMAGVAFKLTRTGLQAIGERVP
jgi:putative transposase